MTRPTTAEVVKLLRQMAKICDVHSNPAIRDLAHESEGMTYALEAANAEPFEVKVERAAVALWPSFAPMFFADSDDAEAMKLLGTWDVICMEKPTLAKVVLRHAESALRAAGVEG